MNWSLINWSGRSSTYDWIKVIKIANGPLLQPSWWKAKSNWVSPQICTMIGSSFMVLVGSFIDCLYDILGKMIRLKYLSVSSPRQNPTLQLEQMVNCHWKDCIAIFTFRDLLTWMPSPFFNIVYNTLFESNPDVDLARFWHAWSWDQQLARGRSCLLHIHVWAESSEYIVQARGHCQASGSPAVEIVQWFGV